MKKPHESARGNDEEGTKKLRKKRFLFALITVGLSLVVGMLGLELFLRLLAGELFFWGDVRGGGHELVEGTPAQYDRDLGYIPRTGTHKWPSGWSATIDSLNLRSNGAGEKPEGRPLLAVGDSFTFGEEVNDDETWPAYLEHLLGEPVLNAGVFGYGFDQIALRAERLIPRYKPGKVIIAVISGDVDRCEYSYLYAWKPYFDIDGEGMLKRFNSPVPELERPGSALWSAAGYSFLARAIFQRLVPDWWLLEGLKKEHDSGREVAARLLTRLCEVSRANGAEPVLLTLRGRREDMSNIQELVSHARGIGLPVIDLATEITKELEEDPEKKSELFARKGHLSPQGNSLVAGRIAAVLTGQNSSSSR